MMKKSKQSADKALQLDSSIVDRLDLSKVPLLSERDNVEVSAQLLCEYITTPCSGERMLLCDSKLHSGYNILRAPDGCVWMHNYPY